ncbi:hypothetical protein [Pedobacter sp. ASV12]|uniref:hypothetical protein n=1 Tax=Pedobacter sp. ASV12 TaxID=2795120 RepID=UPI0018ECE2A1|nr:hypothetical protein [Pedobacter sp. ASV12]
MKRIMVLGVLFSMAYVSKAQETLQTVTERGYTTTKNVENAIVVQEGTSGNHLQLYQQAGPSYLVAGNANGVATQRLAIYAGGGERLSVLANGNIGVGIANPLDKLHINGILRWGNETSKSIYSGIDAIGAFIEQVGQNVAESKIRFQTSRSGDMANYTRLMINPEKGFLFENIGNGNGNVGIGVASPSEKLTVNGNINIFDPTGGAYLGFGTANNNEYNTIGSMYASAGLVLAHGLKPHSASEQLVYSHGNMARSAIVLGRGFSEGGIKFYTKNASSETIGATFLGEPTMQITDNGNVGIGTTTPNEKLSVNGKIRAKEIKVETANWPDYVFEEGYKVGTLQELESYIKANKHLPEMPSAKEVEANGVELGEMMKLQQKKIEELTLYLIEKDKELTKNKELVKCQNEKLQNLEERQERLEALLRKLTKKNN